MHKSILTGASMLLNSQKLNETVLCRAEDRSTFQHAEQLYHACMYMSISRPPCVHAGGCAVLPLPGEVPVETSVCPYCIYYHQLSDREHVTEQTHDQHPGHNKSCHGNSPCHTNSPCHCSNPRRGDPQVSEPKKKLYRRCWAGLQTKLDLIVGSRYFNRGIMIAILINTLSMGIEYHEQVCLHVCVWCAARARCRLSVWRFD